MFEIFFLLLIIAKSLTGSLQCAIPSFNSVTVYVNHRELLITGCISPDSINLKGRIDSIVIVDQIIPDLNTGAVQNIMDSFYILLNINDIEIIREAAFLNLPNLKDLILFNNNISWISERAFTNLPLLKIINLHNNKPKISINSFNDLPSLEEVNLSNCNLKSFNQNWFHMTPRLQSMFLQHNLLESIQDADFINLPSLKVLNFNSNRINYIHNDAFKGLRNLEDINLNNNYLKTFEFNPPRKLSIVSIQFNNITFLSDNMLERVKPSLKEFFIIGNPWQCACFDKIIDWGRKNSITITIQHTAQELICIFPKTNLSECSERSDDDFYMNSWIQFDSEKLSLTSLTGSE